MTAALVARTLGLSEDAVAAFSGTGLEFAREFGKSEVEGEWAIGQLGPPPGPPEAATGVIATIVTSGRVSVSWISGDNPGSDVWGIFVQCEPSLLLSGVDGDDHTSPALFDGNFAQGVAYTFTVREQNDEGLAPISAPSPAVTPNP